MARRHLIQSALAAWRDAEQRLELEAGVEADALRREVDRHRAEFQRLSAQQVPERMDELKEADYRRATLAATRLVYKAAGVPGIVNTEVSLTAASSSSSVVRTR
jgi:hypothetical protein